MVISGNIFLTQMSVIILLPILHGGMMDVQGRGENGKPMKKVL